MKHRIKELLTNNKIANSLLSPLIEIKRKISNPNVYFFNKIFSNIIEGNLIVTVDNIPGKFEIDARSHILKKVLISKEYEPEIVDLILKNVNPEKDAINVGANIGLYVNLLADNIQLNGKVLAIEPTPNAFHLLKANIERNENSTKVILFNGIASDSPGIFKINIVPGNEEYSSVGDISHLAIVNKDFVSLEIVGETIDNLVERNGLEPGIIVIDVEGAENNVLNGAIETLKKYHPVIITELDDNLLLKQDSDSLKVIKFLQKLNYEIMDSDNKFPGFPFMGNIIAKFKNN